MGIYIKGMEVPKDCGKCFVGDRTICANGCPLVDVKEPHGRSIDKYRLLDKKNIVPITGEVGYIYTKDIINAPTVIEATDK